MSEGTGRHGAGVVPGGRGHEVGYPGIVDKEIHPSGGFRETEDGSEDFLLVRTVQGGLLDEVDVVSLHLSENPGGGQRSSSGACDQETCRSRDFPGVGRHDRCVSKAAFVQWPIKVSKTGVIPTGFGVPHNHKFSHG